MTQDDKPHHRSKLTWYQIDEVTERILNGETPKDIAKDYRVLTHVIKKSVDRELYRRNPRLYRYVITSKKKKGKAYPTLTFDDLNKPLKEYFQL